MKKTITIAEFADELVKRIDSSKGIDCCSDEIKNLAAIAKESIGTQSIEVNWKD
jgi:hypothetical protein